MEDRLKKIYAKSNSAKAIFLITEPRNTLKRRAAKSFKQERFEYCQPFMFKPAKNCSLFPNLSYETWSNDMVKRNDHNINYALMQERWDSESLQGDKFIKMV